LAVIWYQEQSSNEQIPGGILLIICLGCQSKQDILSIEISSVSKHIETFAAVDCGEFNDYFKDEILKQKFDEKILIDRFMNMLNKLEKDTTGRIPDPRSQVLIKYRSMTDTICADQFSLKYKNAFLNMSVEMDSVLWNLIDSTKN